MQGTEANSIDGPKNLFFSAPMHCIYKNLQRTPPNNPNLHFIKETKIQACSLKLFFILQKPRSCIRVTAAHSPLYSKKDKEQITNSPWTVNSKRLPSGLQQPVWDQAEEMEKKCTFNAGKTKGPKSFAKQIVEIWMFAMFGHILAMGSQVTSSVHGRVEFARCLYVACLLVVNPQINSRRRNNIVIKDPSRKKIQPRLAF